LIDKLLVAPLELGSTGLLVKLPQVIPDGRPEHDKVTGWPVPAFKVVVIETLAEPPEVMLNGPLFDNE
jgi:hypothetical protein